jgi:hypothetical protein
MNPFLVTIIEYLGGGGGGTKTYFLGIYFNLLSKSIFKHTYLGDMYASKERLFEIYLKFHTDLLKNLKKSW